MSLTAILVRPLPVWPTNHSQAKFHSHSHTITRTLLTQSLPLTVWVYIRCHPADFGTAQCRHAVA